MNPALAAKAYATAANTALKPETGASEAAPGAPDFAQMVTSAVESVVESGQIAEQTSLAGISGKTDPVSVVTAVAETELALETMVSIRDKVISAYEEILRMPI